MIEAPHYTSAGEKRDSAFALLAEQPDGAGLELSVVHDRQERRVELEVPSGCRALVEIRSVSGLNARSDGRVIQINYGLAAEASDDELAVIFAHEFGHLVLEHRRRLSTAGVEKGFFGEFGRNQQLNRQVEVEADRIAAHLLANAGYDPAIAPRFWRSSLGRRAGGGLLRSSTYPSAEARAQAAFVRYQQAVEQAFREVSDGLVEHRKRQEFRVQQEGLVASLRDAARLADIRYRGGVTSYLEVLDTERQLFEAELTLARAQRDELLAIVRIFRAVGGGWATADMG